ncbi:MAG: nitroreductase family protein [Candidatus Omnitrophica bacterium]|nr:nitroreductase family protein [Candidatus Omnitrophota bacterium]
MPALSLKNIIEQRRSIRRFICKSISTDTIKDMVDMARWAPCPNNIQPWRFYFAKKDSAVTKKVIGYLENKAAIKSIAIALFLNDAIRVLKSCDSVLYVFNNNMVRNRYKKMVSSYYQKKANLFEEQAIAAAIENMMLYAETLGIGGVWLGSPVMVGNGIKRIIGSPYELSAVIALGYYDKRPGKTPRMAVDEILTVI